MKKKIAYILGGIVVVAFMLTVGGGCYMLSYSLTPDPNRRDIDSAYNTLFRNYPEMVSWVDSMKSNGLLKDTFMVMPDNSVHHAIFARCDTARGRTAIIVHGYKDCAVKFLYLGKMYHDNMGYNILMPDLYAHGLSEGDAIQMGWKDREDVMRWAQAAERMFHDDGHESKMVLHGVSMGAATIMDVSGEELPEYISCFVEDCGYTSVWDEFKGQAKEQFSLPSFPLLPVTSLFCQMKYGWNFKEASPLSQVAKCEKPMLFIHGDADDFVPTWMVRPLYESKPGIKELWITAGTKHAESYKDYPEEYNKRVKSFVSTYM